MTRGVPWILLVLAACNGSNEPIAPKPISDAAKARLAQFADPASWDKLDANRLRDPRTGIVFIRVAAGEFEMGDEATPYAQPRHRVQITEPYLLAETELTVGHWRLFVDEFEGDPNVPVPEGDDELPMTLSFRDAETFARRFGYRLPTEAQWERAAFGGAAKNEEPWATEAGMSAVAWFHRNSDSRSHPVRQKAPNGYGFYDMLGNLWEWCVDDWDPVAYGKRAPSVSDPVGSTRGAHRVLRGGSWFSAPPGTPRTRMSAEWQERNAFYGVRFACNAPPIR